MISHDHCLFSKGETSEQFRKRHVDLVPPMHIDQDIDLDARIQHALVMRRNRSPEDVNPGIASSCEISKLPNHSLHIRAS